ncbi:phage late control D family protein [Brevibacillus laterosporus]
MESRRVELVLLYQDVDVSTDIAGYLIDFSFGDNGSGQADDLQVKIEDRLQLWQGEWMGKKGDRMQAFIKTINWNKENTTEILPCGEFDVDNIEVSGPPDELSIKGVSVPVSTGGRNEKVTKAWEKVTLQRIAKDIAAKSGLSLMYLAKENPTYDRIDQTKQANLAFIQDLAKKEGLSIKVTNKKLVIYDDELLEKNHP